MRGLAATTSPMTTIAVTCPEDASPGRVIRITTPRGYDFEFEIPDDVIAGDVFDVEIEEPSDSGSDAGEEASVDSDDEPVEAPDDALGTAVTIAHSVPKEIVVNPLCAAAGESFAVYATAA